ncbi:MAG TPA: hypothetical protein VNT55_01345 [Baekduia sp.]|nr:hypothetical protein [Baekduia sp.]
MSPDPFDVLRDQLVAAAAPAGVRASRRRRWRPLVLLAAALALGGTATATAVLLVGEDSPPLKGRVPGAPTNPAVGGIRRYAIGIAPDLRAGAAGWCSTVQLRGLKQASGGAGCGPALLDGYPEIAGGGMTAGPANILNFAVVDRRVATVVMNDGRRIVPRADPGLPFGWRVVVAFTPMAPGSTDPPGTRLTLLDAGGHALATVPGRPGDPPVRSIPSLPTVKVDAHDPPARPCAIEHDDLPHLAALDQTIVRGDLTRRADIADRAFRTCSAALFRLDGVRLRAAVVVDARGPAHAPAALPRSYVPDHAAARREANSWLIVDGGTPGARRRLLAALTFHHPSR